LGNEKHESIHLFEIMSNKRPGGNVLNIVCFAIAKR